LNEQSTRKPATFWRSEIDRAIRVRTNLEPWWDANDKAYAPTAGDSPEAYGSHINTNRDYTLVERKCPDLFYKRPEVSCIPTPLMDLPIMAGQPGPDGKPTQIPGTVGVQAHEEICNELLGPDGIDALRMVRQATFDVLALSGVGFTKMGYESVTVMTPVTQQGVDPLTGAETEVPVIDPKTGKPASVPVPVYENCFWHHYGPKQALVPADFRSTEWDRAPWLGYRGQLPLSPGNRQKYQLPDTFEGSKTDGTLYFDRGTPGSEGERVFTVDEIWYRSCLYRDDQPHPEHLTHLVLVHGLEGPQGEIAIEEDSPDQTLDGKGGLTPDSLIGFPIHPLNMRTRTDSAWPPADATITRPLVNELNISREQNVQYRDAMTLRWQYNTDTLPQDALGKIVRSPIGGMIGVPGDAFAGEGAIKELPQGSMPRESFAIADYIDNDISRSWAMDASQQGVQGESQTATAEQIQQSNANARLDYERGIVLQWYCKGVTKFATLVQRYLPVERAAQIVGPQRAQIWDAWRKAVPSSLAFTAMPDSALRVDQAVDRKQAQDLYSFLANDPYIQKGRAKLLEKLLRKFHIDPSGIVAPPDPGKPEPPKLSLAFKGEDFIGPQAPIVIEILQQQGITISPQNVQLSQAMLQQSLMLAAQAGDKDDEGGGSGGAAPATAHGGKLAQQESLSKHASDQTGALQGVGGAPGAMGGAGGHLG
jgi:hypothetical protein